MYEQKISFYIEDFKKHDWSVYESDHYIFYVEKNSLAERDIDQIKLRQESAFEKIVTKLSLNPRLQKIKYYFYSSQELKAKLMGDAWYGQSIYNEYTIHAIYNEQDKVLGEHEDTHLLSLECGLPISLFQEGLAESMVGKSIFGNDHNEVIKKGIRKGLSFKIENLMSQQGWLNTPDEEAEFYYSIAGSFTTYLINEFGIEQYLKIYRSMDRKNTFTENIIIFNNILVKDFEAEVSSWLKNMA